MGVGLLVAGLVVVGSSFVLLGLAEESEFSCFNGLPESNGCQSTVANAQNDSIIEDGLLGVGVIVAGVGAGLVVYAIIDIMARREIDFPTGPSPPGLAPAWAPTSPGTSILSPMSPPGVPPSPPGPPSAP